MSQHRQTSLNTLSGGHPLGGGLSIKVRDG